MRQKDIAEQPLIVLVPHDRFRWFMPASRDPLL